MLNYNLLLNINISMTILGTLVTSSAWILLGLPRLMRPLLPRMPHPRRPPIQTFIGPIPYFDQSPRHPPRHFHSCILMSGIPTPTIVGKLWTPSTRRQIPH